MTHKSQTANHMGGAIVFTIALFKLHTKILYSHSHDHFLGYFHFFHVSFFVVAPKTQEAARKRFMSLLTVSLLRTNRLIKVSRVLIDLR